MANLYDLPKEYIFNNADEEILEKSIGYSDEDGKMAANILADFSKEDAYIEAVDKVLEQYYADDENISSELDAFVENLDETANEIVKNYREAWEERMNSENLDYTTDKILVSFDSSVEDSKIEEIISKVADGGTVISGMYELGEELSNDKKERIKKVEADSPTKTVSVNLKKSQSTDLAIETLKSIPYVKSAELNSIGKSTSYKVNDAFYSFQWYADTINLEDAWTSVDNANDADEILVAMLEPGIQLKHQDLTKNILNKYSVDITGDTPVLLSDLRKPYLDEHGTLTGGILAATANNSIGVAGIAGIRSEENNFNCKIMEVNCFMIDEDGDVTYTNENLAKAIDYAIAKGAEVINMSLGGYGYSGIVNSAIQRAYENGIVCVAAAGNESITDAFYPAEYDHVISVISTDTQNRKSEFSNYGNKDICAPGELIWTTTLKDDYCYANGTSMSAPMVSAAVALMKSVNYSLNPDEIENILYTTAIDIGAAGYDVKTANGLLNTGLAVKRAKWYTYKDRKPVIKNISLGTGSISLRWNVIANEEQYEVWRATSANGTFTRLDVMNVKGATSMLYKDTDVKSGKKYYYKLRCRSRYDNGFKHSSYSEVSSVRFS